MMSKIAGIDFAPFMLSVAAKLAHMDAEQQAAFFNTFADELVATCGTEHNAEMQAAYVNDLASKHFKAFCTMVSFVDGDA